MGIRAIVATGEHGESEAALRHVRRHFITRDNLRRAITKLVNATFAAPGIRTGGGSERRARAIRRSSVPGSRT